MFQRFFGVIPPWFILIGTVLSAVIPYVLYKLHLTLHEMADPPWKRKGS